MKKTIVFLGLALLLISCNSNENKMKNGIKDYLDKSAKDPKSYEFVELKIIDTIIKGKLAQERINDNDTLISENERAIVKNKITQKDAEESKQKYKDNSFDEFITGAKNEIETSEMSIKNYKEQNEINKKALKSKDILGYVAKHKFRMKNGFGALDLSDMYVEFDKDFKLLEMDKDINFDVFQIK